MKASLRRRRRQTDSAARWTLSFLRRYRVAVFGLALLSLVEIGLRALTPWPLKAIVDQLTTGEPPLPIVPDSLVAGRPVEVLIAVVLAGVILQLGHELVLMIHTRTQARLAQSMVFDLRSQMFTHLQYLSLAHHFRGPADSVYRLDTDAAYLDSLLLRGFFPLLFSVVTLVVMFAILLRIDELLALVSMVIVPFLYLALRFSMRGLMSRADRAKQLEAAVSERLYESLSAIRLVKIFAREEYEVSRFSGVAQAAIRERFEVIRQESRFSFLVGIITVAGAALVLALGGLHVIEGKLTVGTLLVVITYLGYVYGPLSAIATTTGSLHTALASARRVREVLRLPREDGGHATFPPVPRVRGDVRFEHVSFAYRPDQPVLDDVSFSVSPGETVALVGPSGAGKTTVVSILGRLYEASSGHVFVDDVDIAAMSLRKLREQIAVVPQDSLLLSGTIAENIQYGRLDATRAEVEQAAHQAGSGQFIAGLPRGFDTELGDLGAGLSGGERQRISIARAFLKDAPILILDEPTSALDPLTERAILAAMRELRRHRTTFIIAHRMSTVRDADRIIVLDQGAVTATGRHRELLQSSPLYRRLVEEFVDADSHFKTNT